MAGPHEPIADDEALYRCVPARPEYCDPSRQPWLAPQAFRPRKRDTTGISLYRARFTTPAEAAAVLPGPSYYVAVLWAGALRERGIDVVSAPTESGPPGHTEVPQLRYETRRCALQEGWQRLLAQVLCKEVLGPFPGRGARTGP